MAKRGRPKETELSDVARRRRRARIDGKYVGAMVWSDWLHYRFDARHPGELEERIHVTLTADQHAELPETKKFFGYASGRSVPGLHLAREIAHFDPESETFLYMPLLDLVDDRVELTPAVWRAVLDELPWRIRRHIYLLSNDEDDPYALDNLDIGALEAIREQMDHYALAAYLAMMAEARHRGLAEIFEFLDYLAFMLFISLCALPPFRSVSALLWPALDDRFFKFNSKKKAVDIASFDQHYVFPRRLILHILENHNLLPCSLSAERRFLSLADGEGNFNYFSPILEIGTGKKPATRQTLGSKLCGFIDEACRHAEGCTYPGSALPRSNEGRWMRVLEQKSYISSIRESSKKVRLRRKKAATSAQTAGLTGARGQPERRAQLCTPDPNAGRADED